MTGVLPEFSFVEILEGEFSIDVIGDAPSPVVATAVADCPLVESLEFARRVPSNESLVLTTAVPTHLAKSLLSRDS